MFVHGVRVTVGTSGETGNGTQGGNTLLNDPRGFSVSSSGYYVADTGNCKVVEFPKTTSTQRGISMDAGDEYTVAGRGSPSAAAAVTTRWQPSQICPARTT